MSHRFRASATMLVLLLALPVGMAAQDAGASVRADASVTIPRIVRLRSAEVSVASSPASADGAADVAVTLHVVANVGYRIVLRPASPAAAGMVRVRLDDGALVPLTAGRAVPVVERPAGRSAPVVLLSVARDDDAEAAPVAVVAEAVPLSAGATVLSSLTVEVRGAGPVRDGGDR